MATNKDLLDAIERLIQEVKYAANQSYMQQSETNTLLVKILADTPSRHDY